MAQKGFSIDDLLNPKIREYSPEESATPQRMANSNNIGIKAAKKILKEMKITSFPYDINKIVNFLGAEVERVPSEENSQMLGCYVGDGKIYLVDGLPLPVYRSTLAHELGHLVLAHDMQLKWDTMDSYKDPDPHEQEAWGFASGLLTPKDKLKAHMDEGLKIPALAKLFDVTETFISIQIIKFNLLK